MFNMKRYKLNKLQKGFTCKRCGLCCADGTKISVNRADVVRIARFLKICVSTAMIRYVVEDPNDIGILYLKHFKPCCFYEPLTRECLIYSVRPAVCQAFPWNSQAGSNKPVLLPSRCPGAVQSYIEQKVK